MPPAPLVPLSAFVDYALCAGTSRITQVREYQRGGRFDFYRSLRETIVDMHRAGSPPGVLKQYAAGLLDPRCARLYPKVVAGYLRWLAATEKATGEPVRWFEPPHRDVPLGQLQIACTPELGLLIGGRPHVVKLFMRGEPIGANRVALTTAMLDRAFATTWPGVTFAILDVRRAKLYPYKGDRLVKDLLVAESESFASLARCV